MKHSLAVLLFAALTLSACQPAEDSAATTSEEVTMPTEGQQLYQCPMHPSFASTDASASCPVCGMSLVPVQADAQIPEQTARYQCPMHPHVTSTDSDATCPVCGMSLVPAEAEAQTTGQTALYQCPMHPQVTSTDPDATCPVCGMSLVPIKSDPVSSRSGSGSASDTTISVAPEMIQSMGVRTAPVKMADLSRTLRAFGTVETDERRETVTVSRLEGWIDQLQPRAEGDTVRPGALLYRVYSADLIAAQNDYVNSLAAGNDRRIAAVTQRLKSLGMQDSAIQQLRKTRKVTERVPVFAEAGGIVAQLSVREGDYVKPGTPIMRLQSYDSVWVIASIPEQDLALISTGLSARLNFPSAPGGPVTGAINYIYPTIDAKTRTGKVRIEVDNAEGYLRPGAYADIAFELKDEARLSIPTEAVLRDSRGSHVILARGDGRFSSRSIETGFNTGGRTEIIKGLKPGEQVVTSSQFMLDSEVNLREGLSKFGAPDSVPDASKSTDPHAGHNH